MGPHGAYILAAYLVSAVALGGLAAWLIVDMRGRRRELSRLAEAGIHRRSQRSSTEAGR